MDYETFFSERLAQLRLDAGISARDMSLSMGQSQSYINKIESRQNLPSMAGFFYICEYLGITPMEFFDEKTDSPKRIREIVEKLQQLTPKQLSALEVLIDTMLYPK